MRAAITIVYNGLHHLQNGGFTQFMIDNFDYWVVVEGLSKNGGSTRWIRSVNQSHNSTDGTVPFMKEVSALHDHVLFHSATRPYTSKDEQFNIGISLLKTKTQSCYLWQVDSDEHWSIDDINAAERKLWRSMLNAASFQFNHFVNDDIVAVGDWGSGRVNRLWKWKGQNFKSHEPAIMEKQTMSLELPQKFNHYSMVFSQDVQFKSKIYPGNEKVYQNWVKMDSWKYPCHISQLFGRNNRIGRSKTTLYKFSELCANVPNQKVEKEAGNIPC